MNRNIRIGIFTAIGVVMIVGFSVFVNDHPYWYNPCNLVKIHVDDATGLRRKSPVKTLGLEIGYINDVLLDGPQVLITVCVTGPVRLVPETRAFVRSSGFLGDKFLELKPVELTSTAEHPKTHHPKSQVEEPIPSTNPSPQPEDAAPKEDNKSSQRAKILEYFTSMLDFVEPTAFAEDETEVPQDPGAAKTLNASRDTEIQDMMKKVSKLLDQVTLMVGDLREVTQQKDFKETIVNLSAAMKNLQKLLEPNGKVVNNINASMDSLKNMMDQADQVMKKINSSEGTIGKFVNDPGVYDEIKAAVQSINLLLGKAGKLHVFIDISAWDIPAYNGNRANISVMIQPNPTRYYLVGVSGDPRGKDDITTTTTNIGGVNQPVVVQNQNSDKGLRITALLGKYLGPLELRAGVINDDGAVGAGFWFDKDHNKYAIQADLYSPQKNAPFTERIYARSQVWSSVYVTGGIDSIHKYNGKSTGFFGAGLFFDDDDIKYLLVFK